MVQAEIVINREALARAAEALPATDAAKETFERLKRFSGNPLLGSIPTADGALVHVVLHRDVLGLQMRDTPSLWMECLPSGGLLCSVKQPPPVGTEEEVWQFPVDLDKPSDVRELRALAAAIVAAPPGSRIAFGGKGGRAQRIH